MSQRTEGFARDFYRSWPWIKCARTYKKSVGGLCERCWSKGLIVPGEEVHHKIKLTPAGATSACTWISSDPGIATVSAKGVVKGVKKGTVTIIVTTANGLTAQTKVKVK